ncbi:hypothetical protein [Streptomyces sp. NPDC093544]
MNTLPESVEQSDERTETEDVAPYAIEIRMLDKIETIENKAIAR